MATCRGLLILISSLLLAGEDAGLEGREVAPSGFVYPSAALQAARSSALVAGRSRCGCAVSGSSRHHWGGPPEGGNVAQSPSGIMLTGWS